MMIIMSRDDEYMKMMSLDDVCMKCMMMMSLQCTMYDDVTG